LFEFLILVKLSVGIFMKMLKKNVRMTKKYDFIYSKQNVILFLVQKCDFILQGLKMKFQFFLL